MTVAADHEATMKSRAEELTAIATARKILKETSSGAVGQTQRTRESERGQVALSKSRLQPQVFRRKKLQNGNLGPLDALRYLAHVSLVLGVVFRVRHDSCAPLRYLAIPLSGIAIPPGGIVWSTNFYNEKLVESGRDAMKNQWNRSPRDTTRYHAIPPGRIAIPRITTRYTLYFGLV